MIDASFSFVKWANAQLEPDGLELSGACCVTQGVSAVALVALFVLGCIAAAGGFSGSSALGWTTVGLAGGAYLINLAYGKFDKRKTALRIDALATVVLLTVGVLGGLGHLSITQLGWSIIGIQIAQIGLLKYFDPRPKKGNPSEETFQPINI